MALTKLQKEYCKINGWIRLKGILIDTSSMGDYDEFFVSDENKDDYYKTEFRWCDEEGNDEGVYDDSEIIEHIEDMATMSFEDFKKRKK